MSFAREKRLLLGLLALLAPLPLPFNEVLEWPVLIAYLVVVGVFLRRAWLDRPRWLPTWGMNVLGLLYLPVLVFDLLVLGGGRVVGPVVHLALFTVVVKLFSLARERDKWQALIGIFFLFLAGMATSVHPSVVVYLLAFLGLALLLLARFAYLHLLAGFGRTAAAARPVPFKGVLTAALLVSIVVAVPLFALLPRVRTPYIVGRGIPTGPRFETTGFSDEVTLDSIGLVRTSREVALRVQYEGREGRIEARRDSMRFKAATFDIYRDRRWERSPRYETLYNPDRRRRPFELAEAEAGRWAEIWLQPLASRSLVVPIEAARLEIATPRVDVSRGGALSLVFAPPDVLRYRLALADAFVSLAPPPEGGDGASDLSGVGARMSELAAGVMGAGTSRERVSRLERHLMEEYEYTLDFVGRGGDKPLEDFLFRYRSGHCEYFATAMVLMLRSQGVPARLVTGFLGAEYNPFEGYFVVRQGNAHAWVEAYLADEGRWEVFDPTPAVGRPGSGGTSVWSLATQTYDYVLFRWDRYVLSYDFDDQLQVFGGLRQAWDRFWERLRRGDREEVPAGGGERVASTTDPEGGPVLQPPPATVVLPPLLAAVLALAGFVLYRRLRRPLSTEEAYLRLRQELMRGGMAITDFDPPLAVRAGALERYPQAAVPAGRVFDLYLRESFAGRRLDEAERGALAAALKEAVHRLRRPS